VFDTMSGASRRPRSTARGFDERLRSLFPEVAGDAAYASQLAEDATMLRRELPSARAREMLEEERQAAEEARRRRKWWQVWKR
jgi:septal ring factor EnvC (AmiA/AmiB activator)